MYDYSYGKWSNKYYSGEEFCAQPLRVQTCLANSHKKVELKKEFQLKGIKKNLILSLGLNLAEYRKGLEFNPGADMVIDNMAYQTSKLQILLIK